MLAEAAEKNVYSRFHHQFFGLEEGQTMSCEDRSFEAVVVCGSYVTGHLPVDSLREVGRILKTGGYFINGKEVNEREEPYLAKLEEEMNELEGKAIWRRVEREIVSEYRNDRDGVFHVYEKL